ncbi:ribonuclease P protein subunit p30 [Chelonus insularis]|uniref:ribonuclease P protein subunit p30 n=1 Tax=Chelonus insularis TaxID=460826 RepID=UPI00158B3A69|nr:ribonuclease P protein subunit p30 [Chelonus insularis]XP_034945331.1 ribonuclease P protein subunit p30 [Chelonus insularis]
MSSTVKGFYDLCVDVTNNKDVDGLIKKLYLDGYRIIAINQTIDEKVLDYKKKTKVNNESKHLLNKLVDTYNDIKRRNNVNEQLILLNRLTFIYSDPAKIYALNQLENFVQTFDLIAVIPVGNDALQYACTNSIADVITINSFCTSVKLNRKLYSQAVEKGIFFEIQYADLISPTKRKNMMPLVHSFYIYGKSKNVIISSGASHKIFVRNPYDIINLGCILGLNEIQAKACISTHCQNLLTRSEGRKYGKGLFTICPTNEKNTNMIIESSSDTDDDC